MNGKCAQGASNDAALAPVHAPSNLRLSILDSLRAVFLMTMERQSPGPAAQRHSPSGAHKTISSSLATERQEAQLDRTENAALPPCPPPCHPLSVNGGSWNRGRGPAWTDTECVQSKPRELGLLGERERTQVLSTK